ncbi:hypothetical protein BLNAU_14252 [Blattamonas nauphoetae]|uniref:Uncharacterized protein n=1 Tax=Blattamonas nauphoetae TaxID=2049346 RepID=A0ABQ9XHD6_9EUKA|nr:hypothetical protein BLNAU_14252 [Blattamonas nauphoetae]
MHKPHFERRFGSIKAFSGTPVLSPRNMSILSTNFGYCSSYAPSAHSLHSLSLIPSSHSSIPALRCIPTNSSLFFTSFLSPPSLHLSHRHSATHSPTIPPSPPTPLQATPTLLPPSISHTTHPLLSHLSLSPTLPNISSSFLSAPRYDARHRSTAKSMKSTSNADDLRPTRISSSSPASPSPHTSNTRNADDSANVTQHAAKEGSAGFEATRAMGALSVQLGTTHRCIVLCVVFRMYDRERYHTKQTLFSSTRKSAIRDSIGWE